MKKCSYCGAEYPDDAVMCAVDHTPFEPVIERSQRDSRRRYEFVFAVCFGVGATLLTWLLLMVPSSFLRNVVGHSIAAPIFLAVQTGNIFDARWSRIAKGIWMLIFAQWSIIGLGLSWLIHRLRIRHKPA